MHNLKFSNLLVILALPIFVSISFESQTIFFNRNVWEKFPSDSFSLPIGLLWFFTYYIKNLFFYIRKNYILIIYILAIIIIEYFNRSINLRSLVEKINLIIFIVFLQMINGLNINNKQLNILRIYSFLISCIVIILWVANADFNLGRGGVLLADYFTTYNFEQYGAFLIYCIYVISAIVLKFDSLLFFTYIIVGEILYQISYSRVIYVPMLFVTIYMLVKFFNISLILKKNYLFFKKISINFILLNIFYIGIIYFTNGFNKVEDARLYLIINSLNQIIYESIFFPNLLIDYTYSSHNQFLEILRTSGLFGFVYFIFFLDYLYKVNNYNIQIFFTGYLFIIIGLVILPFTHPFSYSVLGLLILISRKNYSTVY